VVLIEVLAKHPTHHEHLASEPSLLSGRCLDRSACG